MIRIHRIEQTDEEGQVTRQWVLGDSEDAFIPVSATSPSYVGSGAGERSELLHMHEVGRPAELCVSQWPRRRCAHHWLW